MEEEACYAEEEECYEVGAVSRKGETECYEGGML